MSDEDDENLPSLLPVFDVPNVTIHHLTAESTDKEAINADAELCLFTLNMLAQGWQQVRSIGGVCQLATTTMKVLETRRKLLNKQYGESSSSRGGTGTIPSFD